MLCDRMSLSSNGMQIKNVLNPLNYMASSVSGQDEPNRALWLATRAGKIELSSPLETTRCIPQEKFPGKPYNKSFINQACSVKMAGYWPRSFFLRVSWTLTSSRSINTQSRKELGEYPAILTEQAWSITYIYCRATFLPEAVLKVSTGYRPLKAERYH